MKLFRKWMAMLAAVLTVCALATPVLATGEQGNASAATESGEAEQNNNETGYTEVEEIVYAVTAVNIRSGPSIYHTHLGVLPFGAPIRRIAIGDNGWSKVVFKDQIAYIYSDCLSTTRPAGYTSHLDDAELKRQIAIANGLNRLDYTTESWQKIIDALDDACYALGENNQIGADVATERLQNAIADLVRMDYAPLEAALSAVEDLAESDPQHILWVKLLDATGKGTELLTSGDQAAVDAAVAEIHDLLAQLKAVIEEKATPEVVEKEVLVEVLPSGDYCNIPKHRTWPVLFFASLAVNVILVAVIVAYVSRKKRNQRDDTPLVDYDIYDDTL